ncbi:hypothetical protein KSP40_PGU016241 [Platanthera guangdongensis]|uniref:Bifunctional inhibitor/plant lipid transfer protein/seed storage helical domain-containing protein n=1 Tax=Platanthera guangdongensis TaxID=2320717 RepID=A0ABR2N1G7_9ASPA
MSRPLFSALILVMMVGRVEPSTKTECGVAQMAFGMCVPYLMDWDRSISSQCCMAVRSVKELSPTPAARKSVCECLERMMGKIGRVDVRRVAAIPVRCRIHGSVVPTGTDELQELALCCLYAESVS